MANASELNGLLALVKHRPAGDSVEGLDALRDRLDADRDGSVARFLTRALDDLRGKERGGVAYVVAERHLELGDLAAIRKLFATDDADVKESVLNALWGEPPASKPDVGPGIVALALEGMRHPAAGVRAEACSVIQNQAARKVDVAAAVQPLGSLLADRDATVRMQAACAVGNLAKKKYDVTPFVDCLRRNLRHAESSVRSYNAWALWELSRARRDIGSAVDDLVALLASDRDEDDDPRKHAAGALLHHAKKSAENVGRVRQALTGVTLADSRKQIRRFQEQLAALG